MDYRILTITNVRPDPNPGSKIQFIGEIDGETVTFDPFVSCHLEWFEANKFIGKSVSFEGWLHKDSNCYLVSEILGVA